MKRPHLVIVCLLAAASGCAQLADFSVQKYLPSLLGRTGEFRRPLRVVAFWTDTVRSAEGQPSMRGFGGRLMFYDSARGKPVKVSGTLMIYAFDEARADADNPRPDRKYAFTAEQFEKHYSKCELGHSYSFWVPWDEVGGETKEVGLICRFTPVEGGAVVSEQVRQLLPGVNPPAAKQSPAEPSGVKLAQYEQQPSAAAQTLMTEISQPRLIDRVMRQRDEQRMITTTIELPGPPGQPLPAAIARPRPNYPAPPPQPGGTAPLNSTAPRAEAAPQAASAPGQIAPGPDSAGQTAATQTAATQTATQAAAGRAAASGSWLARFGPHRPRAPGAPIVPPDRARGPWRPTRAAPPSAPPPTPTPSLSLAGGAIFPPTP
jgi:hypothetical protein